jgi:solute carrier family 25 (mitochondrial carnitine/acylcarnitine transporter), member 20/29
MVLFVCGHLMQDCFRSHVFSSTHTYQGKRETQYCVCMSDLLKSFLAGWVGGIGNLMVGHPFDTVKTLMQNAPKGAYKSSGDCLLQLVKAEGPLAVYKGVTAPMTGVGVVFAIYFLAYDATEAFLRRVKGVSPTQNLSLLEVMVCGGSTGIFGSLILGPAELLKIRQQTASSKGLDGSFGGVVRGIYAEGGACGFFRGLSATMMRDVPGSMAWFGAYEMTKQAICENPKTPTVYQALVAGGMGGLGMWSFAIPLDAIKTRVQASSGNLGAFGVARQLFAEQGMQGFYRGIGPALLRAFPANAACFAAKEFAQSSLDKVF